MKQQILQMDKETNLKQALEDLMVLDNVQIALVRGVIAGMKMERKIQNDNKVS